jgi:hypothetical protein
MREQSSHDSDEIDIWAEHLVVIDVVGSKRGRPRDHIHNTLRDVDPARLDAAIRRLAALGVVELRGRRSFRPRRLTGSTSSASRQSQLCRSRSEAAAGPCDDGSTVEACVPVPRSRACPVAVTFPIPPDRI